MDDESEPNAEPKASGEAGEDFAGQERVLLGEPTQTELPDVIRDEHRRQDRRK